MYEKNFINKKLNTHLMGNIMSFAPLKTFILIYKIIEIWHLNKKKVQYKQKETLSKFCPVNLYKTKIIYYQIYVDTISNLSFNINNHEFWQRFDDNWKGDIIN